MAEQLNALTTKEVRVVLTKSMPEALAALVVYDPEASVDENMAEMIEAAQAMVTGEVTQSIRDTNSDAGAITVGDWIGLVRGDGIVAVSGTLEGASRALLSHLITAEREIVTIIEGVDAPTTTTLALRAWLEAEYPDLQIECHRGGQPLYPYLFGVE